MSYIKQTSTREEFLKSRASARTRSNIESSLKQFERFCQSMYSRDPDTIIEDIRKEPNSLQLEKIYSILNQFVIWLGEDHPEIVIYYGRFKTLKRSFKSLNPKSIKRYLNNVRGYFEEVGGFEISDRRMAKRVKVPKEHEEEPEPLSKQDLRMLCDIASSKKKTLYMVLKDSGMRIGEACAIRKRDIDITKNPIQIHIPANITKTKRARTTFVTRETRPLLLRRLAEITDDDLVFGSSENNVRAVNTEVTDFDHYRRLLEPICPTFGEKYSHSGYHKITLHTLRSFTATQCAEAVDESFGHGIIGHKKYLGQYIRNNDKLAEKYLRSENHLMIYEIVEVVEQNEAIDRQKAELNAQKREILEVKQAVAELQILTQRNMELQREIMELKSEKQLLEIKLNSNLD